MKSLKGKIILNYVYKSKLVFIAEITSEKDTIYTFRVSDKPNKKDYYSNQYLDLETCKKEAYAVAKNV